VDVVTLGSTFGSLAALMTATSEQLAACPGIGPTKVRRLHDTFHAPFRRTGPRQARLLPAPPAPERGNSEAGPAAVPPPLVPPPLALQPLAPEDGGAAASGEEEEQGPYDEAEEDGADEYAAEDLPGIGGGGMADPTDVAFYASLAPEASDDDQ
jgi:hypothetical protein